MINKTDYAEYLKSEHWINYRREVLRYWGLGREEFNDCIPLCRQCHLELHERLRQWSERFPPSGRAVVVDAVDLLEEWSAELDQQLR